jgi:hypothetical protein
MVEISGKRWKNWQFRWQSGVFLLVIPLIAAADCGVSLVGGCSLEALPPTRSYGDTYNSHVTVESTGSGYAHAGSGTE